MIRLHELGPLRLEGLDRDGEHALMAGEKRTALLTYLVLAGRGDFVRRDTLLALLWPEADEAHARGALRALVHQLRRSLPPDSLRSRGDQALAVDPRQVRCDLFDFERACAADDWEAGVALYRGPLLEGFGLTGAPGFEEWLATERARAHELARTLAWRAATQARDSGAYAFEIAALRRLLAWAPYDEPATRRLLSALERGGDRAGALRVFEQFAARLWSDLEISPSPDTVALAARLRAHTPLATSREVPAIPAAIVPPQERAGIRRAPAAAVVARRSVPLSPAALGVVLLAAAVMVVTVASLRGPRKPSDPRVIAVLPFDVTDPDSVLGRWGRMVPPLIEERLNREVGPKTADLGATLRAAAERRSRSAGTAAHDAVDVARRVGAGRAVYGVVGPAAAGVMAHATLIDAASGETLARASVTGPADSLDHLLDRLIALLLARGAGEPEERVPHLHRTPLPALLWYLEGQALRQAGRFDEARNAFAHALDIDSTFATAGLAVSVAAGAGGGPWLRRGLEIAWRWRERLMPSDRDVLIARLGPRYPEPSSRAEQLEAWEALVSQSGDRPYQYEVLYGYGDYLFHYGTLLGIADAHERARVVFERASQLDPTSLTAIQHLADLAFIDRDTARLGPSIARLLEHATADTVRWVARWMLAAATGDGSWPAGVPQDLDMAPLYNLPLQAGVALADAERVAHLWRGHATTPTAAVTAHHLLWLLAFNRGRPGVAALLLDSAATLARSRRHLAYLAEGVDWARVLAALYWDADTAAVSDALARLAARAPEHRLADPSARRRRARDRCVLEEWRLWHGGAATVERTIRALRGMDEPAQVCAAVLDAFAAVVRGAPDADRKLDALDSLARTGPVGWDAWFGHGNLLIARLYERQGRLARAYSAIRRRGIYYLDFNQYLSTYAREEGRLALLMADTAGAIRAWRHYLGLREAPEPTLVPDRDRIRDQWAKLLARP